MNIVHYPEVELLSCTPDAANVIAAAARQCCLPGRTAIRDTGTFETAKFLWKLHDSGHLSVFEHASFTFLISNASRACTHQLVRHRMASYSQQSQRYTTFDDCTFVMPESAKGKPDMERLFTDAYNAAMDAYKTLIAAGILAEDARYVLPSGASSNIVVTMNFRELIHFCGERMCNRAQWEIRHIADAMRSRVHESTKFLADFLRPKCRHLLYCPEEKSCGLMQKKAVVWKLAVEDAERDEHRVP